MASIFNALHIGYTGLNAAQVGINTTGHNISNAETEGYTRQRVIQTTTNPLFTSSGNVGNGVDIQEISRVFDNFIFDRYVSVSADKEYTEFSQQTLETLSTYFPEIDGVGIKSDLSEYYNMWQNFADNPDSDAMKVALAKQTGTLTQHINQLQEQVSSLQSTLNEQLAVNINEVNSLAEELAGLNRTIDTAEAGSEGIANDLRDRRNVIERSLARLIGSDVNQGQLESNIQIDSNSNTKTGSYTLSVNGVNIVDGSSFHPLHLSNDTNAAGFYEVSYQRQDGVLIPLEEKINGGKVGAIFDLRGGKIDEVSGEPTTGILQNVITQLNSFAAGLIETTNNIYAATSTTHMTSRDVNVDGSASLLNSNLDINKGSFEIVIYDVDANEVARRAITIDEATTMSGAIDTNSIQGQILSNKDDNGDANANNDIDDFIEFSYLQAADGTQSLDLAMESDAKAKGYTFSLEDTLTTEAFSSGSNFAGALGLGAFFEGNDATNIKLASALANNPTAIAAGYSDSAGDNRVALNMVQQQYEKYDFEVGNETYNTTIYGMFDVTATYVGVTTNDAISKNETTTTQFMATELEYASVSKVSVDEELTNLIKYQTSYGAAAKVITTIDQMMQTLLGIKQ